LIAVLCFYAAYLYGCTEGNYTIKESAVRQEGFYHKINSDETLWKISKIYGIEPKEILKANDLNEPSSIKPGKIIYIPAGKTIGIDAPYASKPFLSENNFIWPLKGRVVSFYGMKNRGVVNGGIDIEAEEGSHVLASRSGRVVFTTFLDNDLFKGFENKQRYRVFKYFGHVVIIDHKDGFLTLYANNSEVMVKEGDMVKQGAFIARVGALNRDGYSRCLHFEIREGDKALNPFHFLQ
jgi:murein DD-endopeptidase MepM/ murein hydrolase activator NlpD